MNRQAANLVRQWSAIHRCQRPRKVATATVDHPTIFGQSQRTHFGVTVVSEEGLFTRVLLSASLFLQRATWFALFVVSLCSPLNSAFAADDVFSPPQPPTFARRCCNGWPNEASRTKPFWKTLAANG